MYVKRFLVEVLTDFVPIAEMADAKTTFAVKVGLAQARFPLLLERPW